MASILEVSASSDSEDDVDYVPSANAAASDSSFDEEDVSDVEGFDSGEILEKKTKRGLKAKDKETEIKSDPPAKIDEKQRATDLWESFLNDVESAPKKSNSTVSKVIKTETQNDNKGKAPERDTKPISEIFAEETLAKVDNDQTSCHSTSEKSNNLDSAPVTVIKKKPCMPIKRGIDSVLGTIMNKNKKLTVLEKSLNDWKTFKKDEGIDSELEKFNKGKLGFIERQRFLERSDVRSFEVEKSMRQTLRKK